MTAQFVEVYNGYWVSAKDRKVRNFLWENTMEAENHFAIFIAQTMGAGRGTIKVKLTFDGFVKNVEGEGIWTYDRDKWFWRMTFKDHEGKDYVFITFKEPRGPLSYSTFRTSVFGVIYSEESIVGYVRWRITLKEVSKLYKTIKPFKSKFCNLLYRTCLMYPVMLIFGSLNLIVSAIAELIRSGFVFAWSFYMGEITSDFTASDFQLPYPLEIGLSNDAFIKMNEDWDPPV